MKKTASLLALIFLLIAGCVSIYDNKVRVQPPGQVDVFNRNVLDQCTPHEMPHRLIQAAAGMAYPALHVGPSSFDDQGTFDRVWEGLSVQPGRGRAVTADLKPVIDWSQQEVYLLSFPFDGSCQKVKPYGDEMTTDCYDINILIYSWTEGDDCQQKPTSYPVYLYIYPKENLPVILKWIGPTPTFTPTPTPTARPTATPTPESEDDE